MDAQERQKFLKEEIEKIHQLEKEVKEIEKIERQQLKATEHTQHDKDHEKAKRAITHDDPRHGFKDFFGKFKFVFIGVFVAILVLAIVLVPTKTVEVNELVEYTELEPYNVTEEAWVTEETTIEENISFTFETRAEPISSLSGLKEEYVLWEITIRNFEDEEGCWEYDYTVYLDGDEHDEGTIRNMCVAAEERKTFTTPLYDFGIVEENQKIEYSLEISPSVIPKRTLAVEMNQTVLKETIVTKFRNVTKEKNETVNKTVNWLLGFSIF